MHAAARGSSAEASTQTRAACGLLAPVADAYSRHLNFCAAACWDFAALGTLEAMMVMNGEGDVSTLDLSAQQVGAINFSLTCL